MSDPEPDDYDPDSDDFVRVVPQYTLSAPMFNEPTHEQVEFFAAWLNFYRTEG